jgi:hypothetical protein
MSRNGERIRLRHRGRFAWTLTLAGAAVVALALLGAGGPAGAANGGGKELWQRVAGKPAPSRKGAKPAVNPRRFDALRLDRAGIATLLAAAPTEHAQTKRDSGLVVSLPDPSGAFQAFAIEESPVMEAGLAAKHPEITTYAGRGIDDPTATIRADLTPLGFHASVRSKDGAWYIDPYYSLDDSLYASYYGREVRDEPQGVFVERDADAAELSVDRGYFLADDTVTLSGSGYGESKAVTITISDPAGSFADRTVAAQSDTGGSFTAASPPTPTATSRRTLSRPTTAAPPPRRATRSSARSRASTRRRATSAARTAWR